MSEELSYVIVTPYSIRKSRTGGILARLISRTGLDLVGARMFAPGKELTEKYASLLVTDPEPRHRATQELIRNYVLENFQPRARDQSRQDSACARLAERVGSHDHVGEFFSHR